MNDARLVTITDKIRKAMFESGTGRWIRIILGTLLSVVLLYLAMRGVALAEAWRIVSGMHWPDIALALSLIVLSPLLRAWRWRKLYEEEAPPFWLLVHAIASGQTLNFVIPFRSGDLARVLMVGKQKLHTAGTIAFEKVLDAGFFAGLCFLLPFFWAVPGWLEGPRATAIAMAAVLAVIVVVFVLLVPRILKRPGSLRFPSWRKLPFLIGITFFLGFTSLLVNDAVFRALGLQLPFVASVVLLIILQAGVAIPSTPGKLGVFQYLAVLGLSLFKVDHAPALAFGLVMHILVFLPVAIMTAVFFFADERRIAAEAR
jgi:uncharacterized membrane protein YbhN (UPF0104 family)